MTICNSLDLLIIIVFWIGVGFLLRQSHTLFSESRNLAKKKISDRENDMATDSKFLKALALAVIAVAAAVRMLAVMGGLS
jgi:hypothetical protein